MTGNQEPTSTILPGADPDTIDLDQFLNVQTAQAPYPISTRIVMPEADRMVVVGILPDDSGSMRDMRSAVIEGLNMSVEAFRGAKGSDFLLNVMGFRQTYFTGMLKDVENDSFRDYMPNFESTPLVDSACNLLRELRAQAKKYHDLGIPTTVALLLLTDGQPYYDHKSPEEFKEIMEANDYIVGMGIAPQGDDRAIRSYIDLFESMGITKVVTPNSNPAEVRHAINQFSQSVASIAGS